MKQSTSYMKQSTCWNAHGQGQEDDREARSRDDGKLHGSPSDGVRRRRAWTFALTLVAIQLGLMFVGALMPTPLYPLYRQAFGFSGIVLTLIFAVYVRSRSCSSAGSRTRSAAEMPACRRSDSGLPAPPYSLPRRAHPGCSRRVSSAA